MAAGPQISQQKILAASQGDQSAMLEVLQSIGHVSTQQQTVTGTIPTGTTAGQVNRNAPVPPQATGSVSILNNSYIVQIVNPGATSPISQLQAAQAAGSATAASAVQAVKSIYHQIRVSTSPAFNVNSNTQTFGGNTGSAQNYWTLTGLGKGTWYFQFRSSYDGINFNTWRNANGGEALGGLINQVTEENVGNANWALFTLPGSLVVGVGEGYCTDGEVFDLAEQVYSSGMMAIAGPNGFSLTNYNAVYGIINCDVDISVPSPLPVSAGIPDYPVQLVMRYGQAHTAPIFWSGQATIFAIAFDPTNPNVTLYQDPAKTAVWATMRLPGGAKIAIGQGKNNDGETIWTPPGLTWISGSRMISICSFTDAIDTSYVPNGYSVNQLSGLTMAARYNDNSDSYTWATTANWLAVAWEAGTDVLTAGGANFLQIQLQGGHSIIIGGGQSTSGAAITLPAGYSSDNMLSICTPASTDMTIHHQLTGITTCAFTGLVPVLIYLDDKFNSWSGNCNWMVACWK